MQKNQVKNPFKIRMERVDEEVQRIDVEKSPKHIKEVRVTGEYAVDIVQMAIKWHQDKLVSLRTISLAPRLYERFWDYMNTAQIKAGRQPLSPEQVILFYDVDIKKGSFLQQKEMYFEHYTQNDKQKGKDVIFNGQYLKPGQA